MRPPPAGPPVPSTLPAVARMGARVPACLARRVTGRVEGCGGHGATRAVTPVESEPAASEESDG